MALNKHFDSWLHWNISKQCNLDCTYCFDSSTIRKKPISAKIDLEKILSTLIKTNKKYLISFTGGEPFLVPGFIELCQKITKKYIMAINTNLSVTENIKHFIEHIPREKVLYLFASLHLLEQQKNPKLEETFINNYLLLKKQGFNITASYLLYPALINNFEQTIAKYETLGITVEPRLFIGKHQNALYPQAYTQEIIDRAKKYTQLADKSIFFQRGTLCNAGYNAAVIDSEGQVLCCDALKIKIGDINQKIDFLPNLLRCPREFCACPLKIYQADLFKEACLKANAYSSWKQNILLLKNKLNYKKIINKLTKK